MDSNLFLCHSKDNGAEAEISLIVYDEGRVAMKFIEKISQSSFDVENKYHWAYARNEQSTLLSMEQFRELAGKVREVEAALARAEWERAEADEKLLEPPA